MIVCAYFNCMHMSSVGLMVRVGRNVACKDVYLYSCKYIQYKKGEKDDGRGITER